MNARTLTALALSAVAIATAVVIATAVAVAGQDGLSEVEQRIVERVDARNEDAVAFLEAVVNVNSGTLNGDGVREVGRMFAPRLEALGFVTEWIDGTGFQRAGHLFARRDGGKPCVLLIGHLDTVFEPDSPFQRFERRGDHVASGPGIADMKGGDVIIVEALAALHDVGVLDDLTVIVALIGDEERPGRPIPTARAALIDAAREADIALAFENGDNLPETAVIARRGASKWRLEVTGTPAHSSQIFRGDIGAGAIFGASRILDRFYDALSGEEYLTINPGVILGGTDVAYDTLQSRGNAYGKTNVVAEHAVVSGDLRTISPEQLEHARARMREIAAAGLPGTSARITFSDDYPPMAPTGGNRRLLEILSGVSEDLGFGPVEAVDPNRAGAADVAFTAGLVEMGLDGLGLLGDDEHTEGEWADLRTLPMQTKRTAILLYRLRRP